MSTVTLPAAHLVRILSNVLPHTGNDGITKGGKREYWLPALSAVRLETDGSSLLAVATDRYTIGKDFARVTDDAPAAGTFVAMVNRDDVAAIVKTLKSAKLAAHVLVTLTLDLVNGTLTMDRYGDHVATYELVDAEFPRWRVLFPVSSETLVIGPVSVSVHHLMKFAKLVVTDSGEILKDWNGHLELNYQSDVRPGSETRQTRPFRVAAGDSFEAMVMPVRLASKRNEKAALAADVKRVRTLLSEL